MGAAIAAALASEGARVVAMDRDREPLEEFCAGLDLSAGGAVEASAGDVSKREDVRRAVEQAVAEWGQLDVLVAQAGIAGVVALDEITDDAWSKLIDVNLGGVFLSVQEGARAMKDGGAIVVTASTNAFWPEAHTAHYSATKGGILAFAKAAALDLAPRGIRVNVVHPGIIRTRLTTMLTDDPAATREYLKGVPLGRYGEPEEIAKAVLFLASSDAAYITGTDLVVDGGVSVGVALQVDDIEFS
jgi:NAD(P)-dependent dehydrogenase (short-subunit alcohol dehydrogenase family)